MSKTLEPLGIKSSVGLPKTFVLPGDFPAKFGVERRLRVTDRMQKVPGGVALWLRGDRRYAELFDPVEVESDAEPGWNPAMTVKELRAFADANGVALDKNDKLVVIRYKLREAGKPIAADAEIAPWSRDLSVEQLHLYAETYGVRLEGDDNKDDIYGKLERAGLPEAEPEAT